MADISSLFDVQDVDEVRDIRDHTVVMNTDGDEGIYFTSTFDYCRMVRCHLGFGVTISLPQVYWPAEAVPLDDTFSPLQLPESYGLLYILGEYFVHYSEAPTEKIEQQIKAELTRLDYKFPNDTVGTLQHVGDREYFSSYERIYNDGDRRVIVRYEITFLLDPSDLDSLSVNEVGVSYSCRSNPDIGPALFEIDFLFKRSDFTGPWAPNDSGSCAVVDIQDTTETLRANYFDADGLPTENPTLEVLRDHTLDYPATVRSIVAAADERRVVTDPKDLLVYTPLE
jgi:hypothetical protein